METYRGTHGNLRLGRACKTYTICSAQGIKNPLPLGMGSVKNMLYSGFEGVLGDNADIYLKMACAYIDDPDADEGKVFRIWKSRYVS